MFFFVMLIMLEKIKLYNAHRIITQDEQKINLQINFNLNNNQINLVFST